MRSEPFLTVYGHVSIDQIITLKEFPQINTSVDITDKRMYLGGTGGNIAFISASLGTPTAICSFVGDDFPPCYEERMENAGLMLDELTKVESMETSTAIIVSNKENDQITYFYQGPMGEMGDKILITGMAETSQYVHFSTGDPRYYLKVMDRLEGLGKKVSLDPAQEIHRIWNRDLFQSASGHSDILFLNEYELRSALRYSDVEVPEDLPFDVVICTKGREGSIIYADGEVLKVPCIRSVRVMDTTGAGDAYRAGFYSGLYHGHDVFESALLGSSTASFIVESVGSLSNIPSWNQVLKRAGLND